MSRPFFVAAVLYGIIGLLIGLHMAIGGDHSQMPTHAHVQVVGWLSFFLFAVYYQLFPASAAQTLAKLHFWGTQISAPVMLIGLYGLYGGMPELEPLAAGGAIVYSLAFVCFALVVFNNRS